MLSRAFRNRFVELHFDELPSKELENILHQRCSLPPSYCTKLVNVMEDLQVTERSIKPLPDLRVPSELDTNFALNIFQDFQLQRLLFKKGK